MGVSRIDAHLKLISSLRCASKPAEMKIMSGWNLTRAGRIWGVGVGGGGLGGGMR